jgi:hypothetical protein
LPPGLTAAEQALIPGAIDPRWVSEASLRNLEGMGWRENAIERILELLLDGVIRAPENPPVHGPVAAALELLRPTPPAGPAGLAGQARTLYREHARFLRLRPKPWLARLRDLAERPLADWPESLEKALEAFLDHHWVVVDCLGLPLLDATAALLPEAFPGRKLERVEFAAVSEKSSTDAFYLGLVGRDFRKALEKVNVVDDLIHGRKLGFGDLERLARAELEIAFRKLRARLDPSAPLIVFGDHGFRLLADGSGFSHGGPSTLERLVPIVVLSRG